jgi:hypothetical protein
MLVVSPYVKREFVDQTMYPTCSVVKTIELILGLKPMTQFDLSATAITNPITNIPNFRLYKSVQPFVDINEKNRVGLFGETSVKNLTWLMRMLSPSEILMRLFGKR